MPHKSLPEQYAETALRLYLMTDEELDSPEADSIRDKLDPIWNAMTDEERSAAADLAFQAHAAWSERNP